MPKKLIDLDLLKDFRQKYDARLKNGTLVPAKAQIAEQIANVSEDVGSTQEEPFIFQGTATDNGLDSVETAPIAKHLEKQGNSVVVNQLLKDLSTNNFNSLGSSSFTVSNGVATITKGSTGVSGIYQSNYIDNTHKYLAFADIKLDDATSYQNVFVYGRSARAFCSSTTNWQTVMLVFQYNSDSGNTSYPRVQIEEAYTGTTVQVKNFKLVDLTKWGFTADEIADITANPSHFFNYYNGSLVYNAGTLISSNGRYLKCVGRNQWDEEWEIGQLDASGNDQITYDNRIRSKNFIRVIPNAYYNKKGPIGWVYFYDINKNFIDRLLSGDSVFQVPSNCLYMRFYSTANYGSTYNHDITISIYYADGTDYDQYFPYEENTYDTGTEELRSAGSARDIKLPDGSITRKVGTYTFTGNETFSTYGDTGYYWANGQTAIGAKEGTENLISDVLNRVLTASSVQTNANGIYFHPSNKAIYFGKPASQLAGVTLYYELATPTEEQGTSFAENVIVDNYGSMGWLDTDNNFVSVPQGSEFFYPADYVEFLDSLYTRSKDGGTSADVSNIVVSSELNGYVKQEDLSSGITDAAGLTYQYSYCYKIGNVITLTMRIRNTTGSSIAASSVLFKLASGMYNPSYSISTQANLGSQMVVCAIENNGDVVIRSDFTDATNLYIVVSYSVA